MIDLKIKNRIEEIIQEINKKVIPEISQKVKNVNKGGCGIFAYLLSKRLTELGVKHTIREIEECENGDIVNIVALSTMTVKDANNSFTNYVNKVLKTNSNSLDENSIGWTHIMIELDNYESHYYLIDGEGITPIISNKTGFNIEETSIIDQIFGDKGTFLGSPVEFSTLEKAIKITTPKIWNKCFNIEKNTPIIENILETELV